MHISNQLQVTNLTQNDAGHLFLKATGFSNSHGMKISDIIRPSNNGKPSPLIQRLFSEGEQSNENSCLRIVPPRKTDGSRIPRGLQRSPPRIRLPRARTLKRTVLGFGDLRQKSCGSGASQNLWAARPSNREQSPSADNPGYFWEGPRAQRLALH